MNSEQAKSESSRTAELMPAATMDEAMPAIYDCWNSIGVEGNGSCRELVKFVHCRNCPVYSAAGLQLLDRPLVSQWREEWTEHFARDKRVRSQARTSVLLFRVELEWLALPTAAFQEVAERRVMHTLPHRREGIALGLVAIRGELTVCVSLARLLGLEGTSHRERRPRTVFDRLLVTHWTGGRLAFPVSEVHGIHHFQNDELHDPPSTISGSSMTYTQGVIAWRGRTVGVLNPDSLFPALNQKLT